MVFHFVYRQKKSIFSWAWVSKAIRMHCLIFFLARCRHSKKYEINTEFTEKEWRISLFLVFELSHHQWIQVWWWLFAVSGRSHVFSQSVHCLCEKRKGSHFTKRDCFDGKTSNQREKDVSFGWTKRGWSQGWDDDLFCRVGGFLSCKRIYIGKENCF